MQALAPWSYAMRRCHSTPQAPALHLIGTGPVVAESVSPLLVVRKLDSFWLMAMERASCVAYIIYQSVERALRRIKAEAFEVGCA